MIAPLLHVDRLCITYTSQAGSVLAVDDFSIEVPIGQAVALVGASGSGKTTIGLAMLRLLPATVASVEGTILLQGENLTKLSDDQIAAVRGRRIALIVQDPATALNPVLSIGRQLTEVIHTHSPLSRTASVAKAIASLERVGFADAGRLMNAYPHELSGGMRQRVLIAMAISCEPHLLIADEPTTALDPVLRQETLELLSRLKTETGMGLIMISHELGALARYADRLVVLHEGRKVEDAPAPRLFHHACHPYSQALLAAGLGRRQPRSLPGPGAPDSSRTARVLRGCSFAPNCLRADDRCRGETPRWRDVGPAHGVACFHPILESAD